MLRGLLSSTALIVLYFILPANPKQTASVFILLFTGLAAFVVLLTLQVRWVVRARSPILRGVEVLFTSVTFFLVLFAGAYYLFEGSSAGSFSQHLSRTDALYFTVTVFSTVGFGDIVPRSEAARVAVMVQMIGDLVFIGAGIRLLASAAQRGRTSRAAESHPDHDDLTVGR